MKTEEIEKSANQLLDEADAYREQHDAQIDASAHAEAYSLISELRSQFRRLTELLQTENRD